jgi:hypothetical protein
MAFRVENNNSQPIKEALLLNDHGSQFFWKSQIGGYYESEGVLCGFWNNLNQLFFYSDLFSNNQNQLF